MKYTVENKIILNNQEFIYLIEYKKIKNIYFRVKEDLKIHVTCPKVISKKYIENLLKEEEQTVLKMYNQRIERKIENNELKYLGNTLNLIEYNGKPYINNDYIYAKDYETAKNYIYSLAYDIFEERLKQIIVNFNKIPSFTLKVRKMKSKWGVNNQGSMSITLNTELITKDVHLIDYVIVHELCHFYEPNHSAKFWNWVGIYYPYYKEARKQLNH